MFEHLRAQRRIVVTGPQRSGTTIATQMIAADTGHRFVDEGAFSVYDEAAWREILQQDDVVVHCPHMLKDIVDNPPAGIFVVLMHRDLTEIHRSARRIGWNHYGNPPELRKFNVPEGDSAAIKYAYWDSHEKRFPFIEVPFESLRGHPLYVDEQHRISFDPKQTRREA